LGNEIRTSGTKRGEHRYEKPERNRLVGRPRHRWEDNTMQVVIS